ncbi:hypothetical protein QTO34_000680 [Cnephaeus nilssonii]|uniref:TNFR-Cys domain-containing protein n=1 Tax=Cnephaeus nilssonii TaxID=3371016 RepID=A0AA40ICX2_CNENI|nr:hypothetical protein QTO34_000680 [Eptesicus nilssonii]
MKNDIAAIKNTVESLKSRIEEDEDRISEIEDKDCGYGEGGDAYCTACPPRRYKSSWGHHRCQSCITCAVINCVQKANCIATSNAVCGDCLPRRARLLKAAYGLRKDKSKGIDCLITLQLFLALTTGSTKRHALEACRTESASRAQSRPPPLMFNVCIQFSSLFPSPTHWVAVRQGSAFQLSLVKADVPTVPPQVATLVLVISLLTVFTLAFLRLFFLYCKQFFNRHCQDGDLLQFEADKAAKEESLFPMPPGQETNPESPLSESIFETQPFNPILDDDRSSTRSFPTQESFTMASCTSERHSHWIHTPIKCTELDLQKFSSSDSYTGTETLRGHTAESSGERLKLNVPLEVPSP